MTTTTIRTTSTTLTTLTMTAQDQCTSIEHLAIATASSVQANAIENWGPQFALDGVISFNDWDFFHSHTEPYTWLQLDFTKIVTVESLSVVMRYDCCVDDRFRSVGVYVGNQPTVVYYLSKNEQCVYFEGPAQNGETIDLSCEAPTSGRYLTVQLTEQNFLMVNEIYVCGYKGI